MEREPPGHGEAGARSTVVDGGSNPSPVVFVVRVNRRLRFQFWQYVVEQFDGAGGPACPPDSDIPFNPGSMAIFADLRWLSRDMLS